MGAPRRRNVLKSRRRVDDEGEEDGNIQPPEDDSMSEGSVGTDGEDDADGEASDDTESESVVRDATKSSALTNGHHADSGKPKSYRPSKPQTSTLTSANGDTEAMMNGLKISDDNPAEEVHFDNMTENVERQALSESHQAGMQDNQPESRRRDHDEYKRIREEDPAFVPNRGGFFMHDQRSTGPGHNGFRPYGRGAARGRGVYGGGFQTASISHPAGPADAPWAHDLHDTVAEGTARQMSSRLPTGGYNKNEHSSPANPQAPNRSFSTTTRLGDMQIRLYIAGMAEAKIFSGVARYLYTRLPYHRPPLRRDKPVRISIPKMDVKYHFPALDRSFIFIPRALRPNQQGFGRARGRGSFNAGYVNLGPLSSRRTSAYGGSTYSPSAILSRRSSLARELTAPGMSSPSQATMLQNPSLNIESGKPVVRLPPSMEQPQQQALDGSPTVNLPQSSAYLATQKPTYQENRPEDLPMHHPKPERSLQVADIVSPTSGEFNPPATRQQPFHQQVPLQIAPPTYPPAPLQYPHSRHPSHPSQASGSTPLPQIPEAAIHAQPFQPYGYPPPQGFYHAQYPMYYYPSTEQGSGSPASTTSFMPGQQYFYPMSVPAPPPPHSESTTHAGTLAHEAGGTVYYYKPAELSGGPEGSSPYPPAPAYTTAPPTGMEGMVPAPFYPSNTVFYPQPPH